MLAQRRSPGQRRDQGFRAPHGLQSQLTRSDELRLVLGGDPLRGAGAVASFGSSVPHSGRARPTTPGRTARAHFRRWPRLVRYTGLSERTVRTCLERLEAAGIVSPCDPGIVAARIKRADRRPQGSNWNMSLTATHLEDAAIAVLEHQFPGLGIRLALAAPPGTDGQSDGVQSPHPGFGNSEAVDLGIPGCSSCIPEPGTGCNHRIGGVRQAHERGAPLHPNRPRNHPGNRPPPPLMRAWYRPRPAQPGRPGGRRVFRRPRRGQEADRGPAGQACPGRAGRARGGLVAAGAGGIHGREHRRRAQPPGPAGLRPGPGGR